MTYQIANNALENCNTIVQVVELINDDFATDASREMVAAAYAYDGAEEAGYGIDEANIEGHLDILVENGAEFDYQKAVEIALNEKK